MKNLTKQLYDALKKMRAEYVSTMEFTSKNGKKWRLGCPSIDEADAAIEAYENPEKAAFNEYVEKHLPAIKLALAKLQKKFKTRKWYSGIGTGTIEDGFKKHQIENRFTLMVFSKTKPSMNCANQCVEMDGFPVTISGPWKKRN